MISFLRFRPNLLHNFDPQRELNPTPRAWVDGVSDILGLVPPDSEYDVIKGAVGDGPAAEFVGFRKIERALPNLDTLILNPETAMVPTDPAALYAISGGIASRATVDNFKNIVTYCNRMPPEFSVLTISYATRKDVKLSTTPAFTDWAVKHQDVLF